MFKGFECLSDRRDQEEMAEEIMEARIRGRKNIIFLDIDGVIQPYGHEFRFSHDIDQSIARLCERYDPALVNEGDPWDIVAAYYDLPSCAGIMARLSYCIPRGSSLTV